MGAFVHVLFAVLAVFVTAAFVILFHIKLNAYDVQLMRAWRYQSRHTPERVIQVACNYIPAGAVVRYKELWRARFEGSAEWLYCPINELEYWQQWGLMKRLSNWRWMHVPSSDWPTVWQ